MLSVASVQQQSLRVIRGLFALCAAAVLSVLSVPIPVYATDTTVTADVRDGRPASLTVTSDIEGKKVTLPTVTITGKVHNVTQIVVYVNNTYSTSLPLAAGAETYTVAFGVPPGTHEVRIVGLDAYTSSEVSQTVRFAYEPLTDGSAPAGSTDGSSSPVDDYISGTIDAAKATKEEAVQQVQKASSSGPLSGLSDIAFNAFKSVDLISSTDGTGINKMAGRFTLVSAGLAASVFPWSAYTLIQKLRFVPKLTMPAGTATASMRVIGIVLMLIPFLFMH